MIFGKKAIIWDLDNTLYRITPELADILDETMAIALVDDLGVPLDVDEAKALVKESFARHRDGGQIFYEKYNVNPVDLFFSYHNRKPVEKIEPIEGLVERIEKLPVEQYIFTYSSNATATKILRHIGLYPFFKGKYHTVEDYHFSKKNDNVEVYLEVCEKIGRDPKDCIFVDDSYSNLEFAKKAGMTTVRIFYNHNSSKDKEYIDAAYKGIEGFLDAFEQEFSAS